MSTETVKVDGMKSPDGLIKYWGLATKQADGSWQCYADVGGALCVVEVSITFPIPTLAFRRKLEP